MKNKYYISKDFKKENTPIYAEDGVTIMCHRISSSSSMRIHEMLYNTLSDEAKKNWIEETSEN